MAVASANPFALLEEEGNSRPASPTPRSAPAQQAAQSTRGGNQRARAGAPSSRGGRYYQRGAGGPKGSQPREDHNENADDSAKKTEGGERRGRGRGRGGRGRGAGGPGRGRTFDRHSGTGINDTEKKIHQGWGGDDGPGELVHETQGATDAAADAGGFASTNDWTADATSGVPADGGAASTEADPWGTSDPPVNGATASDSKPAAPKERERERDEDEDKLTLDEYLAQQKQKLADDLIPKLETRKANEGADDTAVFKGATRHQKGEDDDGLNYFVGKVKAPPKPRTKKEEKVHIEIDAQFERPRGGGRGRGGDRGGRGRGGDRPRGRGRGGGGGGGITSSTSGDVNVNDTSAFPSLA